MSFMFKDLHYFQHFWTFTLIFVLSNFSGDNIFQPSITSMSGYKILTKTSYQFEWIKNSKHA